MRTVALSKAATPLRFVPALHTAAGWRDLWSAVTQSDEVTALDWAAVDHPIVLPFVLRHSGALES